MGVSKVILNNVTIMDVTSATATENSILYPYTAMTANGEITTGVISSNDGDLLAQQLNNTLLSYRSNTVTQVPDRAFSGRSNIQSIELPNLTTISGDRNFQNCTSLVRLYLPKVTAPSAYMCYNDTSLTDYDFSNVTNLNGDNAFKQTGLTYVYAPKATQIGAFGGNQFQSCLSLVAVRTPNNTNSLRSGCFNDSTSLKLIDLGKVVNIATAGNCFTNCTDLEILILRKTGSISNINRTTDFSGVDQKITVYVPQDLKSSYEANTN